MIHALSRQDEARFWSAKQDDNVAEDSLFSIFLGEHVMRVYNFAILKIGVDSL